MCWPHSRHTADGSTSTHSGGEERSTDISSNGCPLVYMDMGMDTTSTSIKENRAQHVFANFILLCCYVDKCLQPMTLMNDKFALLWGEAQLCLPYVCL